MPRFALVVVTAVTSLTVATAATAALSPPAYRARANALCAQFQRLEHPKQVSSPTTKSGYVRLVAGTLALTRRRYAAFRALEPPVPLATRHRRMLAVVAREVTFDRQLLSHVRSASDPARVLGASLGPGLALYGQELRAWAAIGAATCARGSLSIG